MSFEQYKKVIDAYQSGNENEFVVAARNWIENAKVNPFNDKEPHELFFNAKKYCRNWRNGGIDCRSAKRNMINSVRKIAEMNLAYPADLIKQEEKEKQEEIKNIEIKKKTVKKTEPEKKVEPVKTEPKKEILKEDIEDSRYVLLLMVKAYNDHNDINFKQFAIHLMDITEENIFKEGTMEYNKFEEMKDAYSKHNIRRLIVVSEQLCDIVNSVELEPKTSKKVVNKEPETVLGVLPEDEKEKKSWLRFLNPWKKDDNT